MSVFFYSPEAAATLEHQEQKAPKRSRFELPEVVSNAAAALTSYLPSPLQFSAANQAQPDFDLMLRLRPETFPHLHESLEKFTQAQHRELFLKAIEKDSQPEFFMLYEKFLVNGFFDPEIANSILHSTMQLPSDIVAHIQPQQREDFLQEQLHSPSKNYGLIASILTVMFETKQERAAFDYLHQTMQAGDYRGAGHLSDLIHHALPKKEKSSTVSAVATQLGYVAGYSKWCLFGYSKDRFFESKEFLKHTLTEDNLESFARALRTDTLESISFLRDAPAKDPSIDKMVEKKIPPQLFQDPTIFEFLQKTDLLSAIDYYGHGLPSSKTEELMLLVEGTFTPLEKVLERFEIHPVLLGSKTVYQILDKRTRNPYTYLSDGLVPHNDTQSICIADKVAPSGFSKIHICSIDHGNTSTPEGIKRLLGSHSWVAFEDAEGNISSAGVWGDGKIHSPDLYHRTLLPKNVNSIQVSQKAFTELLKTVQEEQTARLAAPSEFNLIKNNCSSFSSNVARLALESNESIVSIDDQNMYDPAFTQEDIPQTARSSHRLASINSFETRIKLYYAAEGMFDQLCKNKEASLAKLNQLALGLNAFELAARPITKGLELGLQPLRDHHQLIKDTLEKSKQLRHLQN